MTNRRRCVPGCPNGNTPALLLLSVAFLMGGIAGSAVSMGMGDNKCLQEFLQDFLLDAQNSNISNLTFTDIIWELSIPAVLAVLSFFRVGAVFIPLLFTYNGFSMAFSVGCLLRLYRWFGLFPAAALFGIRALTLIPAIFVLGVYAMKSSWHVVRLGRGEAYGLFLRSRRYGFTAFWCMLLCILYAVLELIAVPTLVGISAVFVL